MTSMPKQSLSSSIADVLDATWLTSALSDVGPGERVVDVEHVQSLQTIAEKARFQATIAGPDGEVRTKPYFVKVQRSSGGPGIGAREVMFYRDLAGHLDARTPQAYFAGAAPDGASSVIIMDDISAAGGTPMSAHTPFSVSVAERTLSQLAGLHASTWAGKEVSGAHWLAPTVVSALFEAFPSDLLQSLLDDGRADGFSAELRDAGRLLEVVRRTVARPTTCVVHADTHSGNTYLDGDGEAGWLDWQLVQLGHWALDVSYHLGVVLSVEDRRAHEEHLLRHYLQQLRERGISAPAWADAWELYRSGFAYGYYLWSITRVTAREIVLTNVPRLAAALTDHDSFRRMGVD